MVPLVCRDGRTLSAIGCKPSSGARNGAPDAEALLLDRIGAGLLEEQSHVNLRHTFESPADRRRTHRLVDELARLFARQRLARLLILAAGLLVGGVERHLGGVAPEVDVRAG